ncbi:hypothetical protein VNO78_02406 [Psophocarpus tetragonolobus]|uniref:TF-B3 domain-containing protein n=1 Tax=Psophocarpus tetragonolobus TaxID=3891 RepID=A0AAN9T2L0_PSOTE
MGKGQRQRVPACAACTHNCLLFHPTKPTSPTSFFKIITKQRYLTSLNIPPAFSSTVSHLLNKKITLNDSSEHQWKVKVSEVNGSFVFKEGWRDFSLDHGLDIGYLVLFNYIKDLHFDVKIYGLSACEKLDFPRNRNQKKRSRGRSGSPVRDGKLVRQSPNALVVSKHHVPKMKSQCRKVALVESQNAKESGQLMCISDPCFSTSREFDKSHGVDGNMKIANGDLEVFNVDYGSHIFENDAIVCSKYTSEEVFSMGAALDIYELEMAGRNTYLGEADKSSYDNTATLKIEENKDNKAIMSNEEDQECLFSKGLESDQAAISKKESVLHNGGFCNAKQKLNGFSNPLDAQIHNDEMKEVPVDMTPKLCGPMDKLKVKGLLKENKRELDHYSDTFIQDNESHFKTGDPLMSNGEALECQFFKGLESGQAAINKKESATHMGVFCNTKQNGEIKKLAVDVTPILYSSTDKLNLTGDVPKTLNEELVTFDEWEATGLPKEIKEELSSDISNLDNESHFKTAPPLSCEVPDDNVYLKLPKSLPLTCREKVLQKRKKIVLLQDQQRRLWPVFYHEQPQLQILAHGWFEFSRANNIQPGDECIFEAQPEPGNKPKHILSVRIVHK